jgi:UDP-glucose 4-epimerase
MAKKVLIIGGAGFIGSYITRELLSQNIETILLDAYVQYFSPEQVDGNLHLRYHQERMKDVVGKVDILRGDTRDKDHMRRVILHHRPTHIILLAALPLANISNTFSEEAVSTILSSAVNVLEIIRDVDFVERFVYASSSMIYGDFQYVPADEKHPTYPKNVYGGAKLAGEVMTRTYHQAYGMEYVVVRPSAVYGPTDVNRRVVQIFVENALMGKSLVLRGADETKLDFTYIKDIAHGFVLAALHPDAANETFNITCGNGRSLRELAHIVQRSVPEVEIVEQSLDKSIPLRGALDISKAQEMIGYQPQYQLEDGVAEYIEFVRQCMEDIKHGKA